MKKGITISFDIDGKGIIEKRRGKLTIDEIVDAIASDWRYHGYYAICLKVNDTTIGGNGMFYEEPVGDKVELLPVYGNDSCPFCESLTPPFDFCPECGKTLKSRNQRRKAITYTFVWVVYMFKTHRGGLHPRRVVRGEAQRMSAENA